MTDGIEDDDLLGEDALDEALEKAIDARIDALETSPDEDAGPLEARASGLESALPATPGGDTGSAADPAARTGMAGVQPISAEIMAADLTPDASLIRWLRNRLPQLSGNAVKRLIESGKVWIDGRSLTDPARRLVPGQHLELRLNAPRADRAHLAGPKIYHLDAYIVVAEKPTGILTLPFEEDRDSLMDRVKRVIPKLEKRGVVPPLRAVHRLDKEASGLVVFTRTIPTQRSLQEQFAAHTVERTYAALVHGDVVFSDRLTVRTTLVADRGDGLKGSARSPDQVGKEAVTHFEVIERLPGATLLRCQLETGRTHQIRIHCAEMGHPIVGDPVYIRDYRGHLFEASRMMLHAISLGFVHPVNGRPLRFESPLPDAMESYVKGLRRGRTPGRRKDRHPGRR